MTLSGDVIGKGARFPVVGRSYADGPGDPVSERPIFLRPLLDSPAEHLVLDVETGLIAGTTERGRMTVRLLGLTARASPRSVRRSIAPS